MQESSEQQTPSFDEVYRRYQPLVLRLAHAYHMPGRPYPDRDDLIQAGNIALWEAYNHCTNWDTFAGLAKCSIRSALYDIVTREGTRQQAVSLNAPLPGRPGLTLLDAVPGAQEDRDLALAVREVLDELPKRQAVNLLAVHGLGWPPKAWAETSRRHANTVKQSLVYGRRNFRAAWHEAPA